MEKRGNAEIEVKVSHGKTVIVLPGSTLAIPYDGRFDKDGMTKIAALTEGSSAYFEA